MKIIHSKSIVRHKTSDLISSLVRNATVRAIRIVWRDIGLNTAKGIAPGPFRYKVEVQNASDSWITALDRGNSAEDFLVDYRECPACRAKPRGWSS